MRGRRQRIVGKLLFAVFLIVSQEKDALSCGFDGLVGFGFSAMHPRSVDVALAVRKAVDDELVDRSLLAPIVPGSAGYWRAVRRLHALQRQFSAGAGNLSVPHSSISVLFIDSDLWSRLSPVDQGYELQVHTTGAQPNDIVMVTSEPILAAVLDRRLAIETALERGLIAAVGSKEQSALAQRLLVAALTSSSLSAAYVKTALRPPMRLFGPLPRKQSP